MHNYLHDCQNMFTFMQQNDNFVVFMQQIC